MSEHKIEVYTNPKEDDYQSRVFYELSSELSPKAFPNAVRQWLPEEIHTLLDQQ